MTRLPFVAFLFFALLVAPLPSLARSQAAPDDAEPALKTLAEDLLAAARAGDAARLAALIDNLRLPDHQAWFERAFSPDEGAAQAAKYSRFLEQFEASLGQRFAALATQTGLEVSVERIEVSPDSETVEELPPARLPLALFAVTLHKPGTDFAPRLAWFVHSAGGWRFAGRMRTSTAPPMQIRVASAVQEQKLTNRVAPAYPAQQPGESVEGKVVLEAVIAADGRIKELRVLSGHPTLVAATVAAVQQWRYQPTLLDGEPAEVITTISILFRLAQ